VFPAPFSLGGSPGDGDAGSGCGGGSSAVGVLLLLLLLLREKRTRMKKGVDEIIRELIGRHGTLHYMDAREGTPLFAAVKRKHVEYTKILLEAKADPCFGPPYLQSALECALYRDDVQFMQLLMDYIPGTVNYHQLICKCATSNLPKVLKFLLEKTNSTSITANHSILLYTITEYGAMNVPSSSWMLARNIIRTPHFPNVQQIY
jgi:hypothetical protein